MALGAPYSNPFGTGQSDTIENFRKRIEALYTFIDTIPVDSTLTHSSIAVSDGTTFPAISANTLTPISSGSKAKIKAELDRLVNSFIDGLQENDFIS